MTEAPMNEKMLAREPTEAMIEAAAASKGWGPDEFDGAVIHPAIIWQAMFDAAPDRTPAGEGPHEMFEHFVQEAISNSPEPLQELGKFLADRLDEDDWKTADRLLLAAATRPQASLTAEEVAEIIWTAFWKPTVGEPGPRPRPDDWVHEAANRILARLSPSDRSGS